MTAGIGSIGSIGSIGLVLLLAMRSVAAAQAGAWHSSVEANATALFGASSQALTEAQAEVGRAGGRLSADGSLRLRYGESEDDAGSKFVSSRAWLATVAMDASPAARVSPFVFGSAESSLEQRIRRRWSGGAGAKWTPRRDSITTASLSLALLGERTSAWADSTVRASGTARWSWRLKGDHRAGASLRITHVTFYAPRVREPGDYTIRSTTAAAYALTSAVAVTLTLNDNFDSRARVRGARSNNDGALLFGIRGIFK